MLLETVGVIHMLLFLAMVTAVMMMMMVFRRGTAV